jgi:ABC-2 type transport system ATP-binding protein
MIAVEGLVYDYPGLRALDDVSFTLSKGSITALVGPNGAGKTTLLRCIAALNAPYAGRVLLDGVDVHEHPRDSHRRMGYLSDFFGLYDSLSVDQCLRHRAAIHGIPAAERATAADRAAADTGLAERRGQAAGSLSRGLRQRLAIAQAIIHRPPLLLLDEPASGLDPEARHDLSTLLLRLRSEGMTILVSSHILMELEDYSSHLLILRGGRLLAHRALDGGGSGDAVPIELRLARPDDRLAALLGAQAGVTGLEADDEGARFLLAGDAATRAALLRVLIEHGLAVASFAPRAADLQEAYLSELREDRK